MNNIIFNSSVLYSAKVWYRMGVWNHTTHKWTHTSVSVSERSAGGAAVRHAALCRRAQEARGRVEPLSHSGETASGARGERGQSSHGERRKQRGVHIQHGTGQHSTASSYHSTGQTMDHAVTANINHDEQYRHFFTYMSLKVIINFYVMNWARC